mgnify:CR=1 FL=1
MNFFFFSDNVIYRNVDVVYRVVEFPIFSSVLEPQEISFHYYSFFGVNQDSLCS